MSKGSGIRYAIRMAEGMYSNGPRQRGVPLNKAKLWANIGHLKNHLNGLSTPYHKGATVVEVEIVYQEKEVDTIDNLVAEAKRKARERREQSDIAHARYELEAAKKRLADAEANARRKGIR